MACKDALPFSADCGGCRSSRNTYPTARRFESITRCNVMAFQNLSHSTIEVLAAPICPERVLKSTAVPAQVRRGADRITFSPAKRACGQCLAVGLRYRPDPYRVGMLDSVLRSATPPRFFHCPTVSGSIPRRPARVPRHLGLTYFAMHRRFRSDAYVDEVVP